MSYNGSGTFNLVAGNPVVTSTTISSTWANNTLSDIATGLSTAVTKDGQTTPTANIPMGGFKLTGLGAATVAGDALRFENIALIGSSIQNQTYVAFTTGGTSTAYTLTPTPAITAYTAGQSFYVTFNAASGAAPTLAISAVATPPNLVKQIGDGTYANIAAGDIPINHRSRVTLLSATQALVEDLPAPPQTLTLGTAQASTSGTSIDFTGIPAWVKRVTINLNGVSTNGTSNPLFQIGDSGGVETSGYVGAGAAIDTAVSPTVANYTTGFGIPLGAAGNTIHGSIVLSLVDSANFIWAASGTFGLSTTTTMAITSGSKALTATLDRVRITTVGGVNTFDLGIINILYE